MGYKTGEVESNLKSIGMCEVGILSIIHFLAAKGISNLNLLEFKVAVSSIPLKSWQVLLDATSSSDKEFSQSLSHFLEMTETFINFSIEARSKLKNKE